MNKTTLLNYLSNLFCKTICINRNNLYPTTSIKLESIINPCVPCKIHCVRCGIFYSIVTKIQNVTLNKHNSLDLPS